MIVVAMHLVPFTATLDQAGGVWGRFDHQRPVFGAHELIILVSVAALLAGALFWEAIKRRREREFWFNSNSRLFAEMCHAHRLDRSSRRLLKQLAASRGLKNPAELFVEPDHFDTTNLPLELKPRAPGVRQLRHELFGVL